MSLPVVAGVPSYSDIPAGGKRTFIPEIWSGKLLKSLYDATCITKISNTEYEGEIKGSGDKVIVRTAPKATIKPYTRGQALVYDMPDGDVTELHIDRGLYYAATMDDVSKAQSDMNVIDEWAKDASEQLKIQLETEIFAEVATKAHVANRGATAGIRSGGFNLGTIGSPLALNKDNVIDLLIDMNTVMDEQNVPNTGRWIVIPTWMAGLIKKSDIRNASITGDATSPIRNGLVGEIDAFTIYKSNLLPANGGVTSLIAGTNKAITYAAQISKIESMRSETHFADLMRGLKVYGFGVLEPQYLVNAVVKKGA